MMSIPLFLYSYFDNYSHIIFSHYKKVAFPYTVHILRPGSMINMFSMCSTLS